MADLVKPLTAFIIDDGLKQWRPGHVDCCMFLAAWAMWIGHPDPAQHLRDTYDSEDGFREIIEAAGGVVPVVSVCVARIGGTPVGEPELGSVGVVGSPAKLTKQWGAIFDGRQWLVRTKAGIISLAATPLAIWKI